jgi:membrane-bound metal-dependent hydrolase YbcI (DUF457 family)
MFIAGHVAAGALIGQQVDENLFAIFLLGFISHFLLDLIPHGDAHQVKNYFEKKTEHLKKLYYVLVTDSAASIIMVTWLMAYANINRVAVAWGVIGSVLPDLLVGLNEVWKKSKIQWFYDWHFKVHNALIHKIPVKPIPGAIAQIVLIGAFLYAL